MGSLRSFNACDNDCGVVQGAQVQASSSLDINFTSLTSGAGSFEGKNEKFSGLKIQLDGHP
jgi:hypothetical protein